MGVSENPIPINCRDRERERAEGKGGGDRAGMGRGKGRNWDWEMGKEVCNKLGIGNGSWAGVGKKGKWESWKEGGMVKEYGKGSGERGTGIGSMAWEVEGGEQE